jgi:hypothetical protein
VLTLPLCGPQDQSSLEANFSSSLALFETELLQQPLIVIGTLRAELWVTSDAVDTDVAVKVTDVLPDGRSMLVQDGILRLRWRAGPYAAEPAPPLQPGVPVLAQVTVGTMAYAFSAGHRLRLAVSSSNWPRFSVNPNTGAPLNSSATAAVVASNAVLHEAQHASALILPVYDVEALQALRL